MKSYCNKADDVNGQLLPVESSRAIHEEQLKDGGYTQQHVLAWHCCNDDVDGQYEPAGQGVVLTDEPGAQYVADPVTLMVGHVLQSLKRALPGNSLNVPIGQRETTSDPRRQ